MHYVLLANHNAEVCPTSHAKTRELMLQMGPEIPKIAQKVGVTIVAGPFVNREHTIVSVVETDKAENVDRFLVESRLPQWNTVRILPSLTIEQAMQEIQQETAVF